MISDIVTSPGTSTNSWPVGIHVEQASTVVKVYNNSVNLFGSHTGINVVSGSAPLFLGGGVLTVDVRNNVLANSYDNSSSTTERTLAVNAPFLGPTSFADINYNDYYVNGPVTATNFIGNLGGNATSRRSRPGKPRPARTPTRSRPIRSSSRRRICTSTPAVRRPPSKTSGHRGRRFPSS